ncbi:hypothetical protein [Limnochorda pilosa]|uniref:Uncharacterized protein n=1 Tax=Limnochorda pilosa TaxID=1555112 RepID=A0A0K2SI12_LIMPI|nr:hypothetical protein [Limnochorda pilosa]BAS26652.1 hypothetical protein LIP_0795 [Limnochorda pilosa]
MLTEADRAEIAAVVQEALAGRSQEVLEGGPQAAGHRAQPVAARRPVRVGRPQGAAGPAAAGLGPADGLAELGRSLAELRRELSEKLVQESQERQRLSEQVEQILRRGNGGPSNGGPMELKGFPPVAGATGMPGGAQSGGGAAAGAGAGGSQAGERGTAEPQWAEPTQGTGQGRAAPSGGAGGLQVQGVAQRLAQANFDLSEALNENLRNLKEIVDRSQELVARIENILRRQARGRQGA